MQGVKTIKMPLNRVEGDLELGLEVDQGVVTNAWSSGLMYRGFERLMVGRGALDGLVITPRICGICTTSHLTAAAMALDMVAGVSPPPDAVRIRNLALMTEKIQSDMRHGFLMFAADFVNPEYKDNALFEEAVRRYKPLNGKTAIDVVRETMKVLGIIAIVGGQWPHSSYMVPGGIASVPSAGDLLQCRLLLTQFRNWYEKRILGCSIERWLAVSSGAELDAWLEEKETHQKGDLGFYIRFARSIGLDKVGRGHANFVSYGSFDLPESTEVRSLKDGSRFIPAGFAQGIQVQGFDQSKVAEHVSHSWFEDYEGGRHPFDGETRPYASGQEGKKYSWAKAPRYNGLPAETGPLAEMIIADNPLFVNLVGQNGPTVFHRELARLVRPAILLPTMEKWISETTADGNFYVSPGEIIEGQGFGLTDVTRGACGHWIKIQNSVIEHYQIITPTAWNASPRDSDGVRGPLEEALIGVKVEDLSNPVTLGHVVRSFDACLVCTVHAIRCKPKSK
ncbi:nickel-dependent hydrogenase large subunit [Thermodesulfobacteriota bacterium]